MKKTFTANIAGTVFHIEEDAYEALKRYLENIRGNFSGSTAASEIMSDVEARIAELFTERLQGRNVVVMADVEHVQSIMGRPEDFGGDPDARTADQQSASVPHAERKHKRLFRDMEDKWIGGVIGGFSAYIGTDPLWIRIAFLVIVFAPVGFLHHLSLGSPLVLTYLLMWMLVPVASTTAEKLEMRGEPVTVDNIKKVFDEGAERFKEGGRRVADEARDLGNKWQSADFKPRTQAIASGFERFMHTLFSVLGKLAGVFLMLLGGVLLFALAAVAFGTSSFAWANFGTIGSSEVRPFLNAWFFSPSMIGWAWAHVVIALAVPVLGLVLGGLKLVFDVHIPRWFGWVFGSLWIWAVGVCAVMGVRQANEFRQHEQTTETMQLTQPSGRVLHLAALADTVFGSEHHHFSDDIDLIELSETRILYGYAELDVRASTDSLFHLDLVREARGISKKEAAHRARAITSTYVQQDSLLSISPLFSCALEERVRNQNVRYVVRVPVGGSVRFERGSERVIHDIDNTTGTYDGDMVGRTWTMTSDGLAPGDGGAVHPVSDRTPAPGKKSRQDPQAQLERKTMRIPSVLGILRSGIRI